MSEFALFRAGFALNRPWLMGATLVLLMIVFVSFIRYLNQMLYGGPTVGVTSGEKGSWRLALLCCNVAVLVMLGLTLPGPLAVLLKQSVAIIAP